MKKGIENSCLLNLICVIIFIASSMVLSSCSSQPPMTTTTTSTITITTPSDDATRFVFPDEGIIRLDAEGYFHFKRADNPTSDALSFQNVIFAPYIPDQTTTVPVMYWLTVEFEDGTTENLKYIGLGDVNSMDINLTQHNNPMAGIMLAWQVIEGSLHSVLYLLVSE